MRIERRPVLAVSLTLSILLGSGAAAAANLFVFTDDQGRVHFSDVRRHKGYVRFSERPRPGTEVRHTGRKGPTRAWDGVIVRAGQNERVSPALIKAVIHVESLFDPWAVSSKGAQGLMQLMPPTAAEVGVENPFDPWQNIAGGSRYIGSLMQRFDGDMTLALAAYHAGPTTVRRYGGVPPYRSTQRYVKRVLRYYRHYDADFR